MFKNLRLSDEVVFTRKFKCGDMYGNTFVIPKGTSGRITNVDVHQTVNSIRHYRNFEITYYLEGKKHRVLVKRWNVPVKRSKQSKMSAKFFEKLFHHKGVDSK